MQRWGRGRVIERVSARLRELVLGVVLVHRLDLLKGGCAKHLQHVHKQGRRVCAAAALCRSRHATGPSLKSAPPPRPTPSCAWVAHLDDFDKLVHAGLAREERHPEEQLGEHAAHRPDVDAARVVGGTKYQLGGPVVARANVGHVRLTLHQNFGAAKVAELEEVRLGVDEQILRLDVAMAHAEGMNVGQRAAELVSVQLHAQA